MSWEVILLCPVGVVHGRVTVLASVAISHPFFTSDQPPRPERDTAMDFGMRVWGVLDLV